MGLYDTEDSVLHSFDENFIPEEQLQAQWAEMIELKKLIHTLSENTHRPLHILDIGVGTARVPKHLSGLPEIWNCIDSYDGIDNAESCIQLSNKTVQDYHLADKVQIIRHEASRLSLLNKKYDVIITTWFTGGNFFDPSFPFNQYESTVPIDLSFNPAFDIVFGQAFEMLHTGGFIVLGALYKDNETTRKKQENFYKKIGMEVITRPEETFTATRQGFWSQRFTKEKIEHYFHFAHAENIKCIDLDTYQYAMQVQVEK